MMNQSVNRPATNEYVPDFEKYVSLVPEGDLFRTLEQQLEETLALLRAIPEAQADSRYAPGKWSIKELVGHLIDSERIFAYRALRFSRNDSTQLPGYEQDDYIRTAAFDRCRLIDLASEFEHVRRSSLYMFRHLEEEAWQRRGIANDAEISVRALAYIIAGHELHHMGILRTRYLTSGQTA
jgi:hypothetical protein